MLATVVQGLLINLLLAQCSSCVGSASPRRRHRDREVFEVAHSWYYINFTWPSDQVYQQAVRSQRYISSNNGFSGIKAYNGSFYLSFPRFTSGTPVTLATLPINSSKTSPLLQPYPSWEMNVGESCETFQNVQATEIEPNGVMWVLDGNRFNNLTRCPPKIVLLDINSNGRVLQTYEVPDELSPHEGGWMNDLVVDQSDGGFAYISEVSNQDPGIIVYSRRQNRAWKLRDRSMFQEVEAAGFVVDNIELNNLYSVDGIALDPVPKSQHQDRLFYYTPLTGYRLYAISTNILKNESLSKTANWRKQIHYIGRKPGIGDGMVIDNQGNLYFGLLDEYAIAKWNTSRRPFDRYVEVVYRNIETVDWPDSFGFDSDGNLYVTADESERVLNNSQHPPPPYGVRYRILKRHTGTNSYLYS